MKFLEDSLEELLEEFLVVYLENHDRIPGEMISYIPKRNLNENFGSISWCSLWRPWSNVLEEWLVEILVAFLEESIMK